MLRRKLGLVGYGRFGRFAVSHLAPYFDISIHDPFVEAEIAADGWASASLPEIGVSDVILLAVPLDAFEAVLEGLRNHVRSGALVVDVTSVKVLPVKLMEELLPPTVEILATHPLFGPETAQHGILGQRIVVWPVRLSKAQPALDFLSRELKLRVDLISPDDHDRTMASVQGLTFFIARALLVAGVGPVTNTTPFYEKLLELVEVESRHSEALFRTIQCGNPYSAAARQDFMDVLSGLHTSLSSDSTVWDS